MIQSLDDITKSRMKQGLIACKLFDFPFLTNKQTHKHTNKQTPIKQTNTQTNNQTTKNKNKQTWRALQGSL